MRIPPESRLGFGNLPKPEAAFLRFRTKQMTFVM